MVWMQTSFKVLFLSTPSQLQAADTLATQEHCLYVPWLLVIRLLDALPHPPSPCTDLPHSPSRPSSNVTFWMKSSKLSFLLYPLSQHFMHFQYSICHSRCYIYVYIYSEITGLLYNEVIKEKVVFLSFSAAPLKKTTCR